MQATRKNVVIISEDAGQRETLPVRLPLDDAFVVVFPAFEAARASLKGASPDLVIVAGTPDSEGTAVVTASPSLEPGSADSRTFHLPAEATLFESAVRSILKSGGDANTEPNPAEAPTADPEGDFRRLFESSHIGMAMVGKDHYFQRLNPAYCRMTGYSEEELKSMTFSDITHPDDRAADLAPAQKLYSGAAAYYRTEKRYKRKDGEPIWVRLNSWIAGDHSIAIIEDITERVQSEQQQQRLLTAVAQASEGVVITDVSGIIQYCNPAFEELTGYSREEALGCPSRLLRSGVHGREFYDAMWNTILGGEVWQGRITNRRKDGSLYEEEMTISPVRGEGKISGFVALKRDITERFKMERQVIEAQRLESIGRLAGGVAHEFNNLLTVINGYGSFILKQAPADGPLRGYAEEIVEAGNHAARLTGQMLAFGRKSLINPRPFNLNREIQDFAYMLRKLIGEDIRLETKLETGAGSIVADPDQVRQVIMNLVVNARDAMPDGGNIEIATAMLELDAASAAAIDPAAVPGRYILMTVTDDGHGINPETRQHIFEPFFTTKGVGKGTGLGLAMVYGFVRQSDGWITVQSDVGFGTSFSIYLPWREPPATAEESPAPVAGASEGGETVLLIEDQAAVRSFLRRVLKKYGYQILDASGGEEAIELAGRHEGRIHLLLSDVILPGMNGKVASERLRASRPDLRVLLISGYSADAISQKGVLEPGTAFLEKPFTPDQLALRIRQLLDDDTAG